MAESIFNQENFNIDNYIPKEEDFELVCEAYADVKENGEDANINNDASFVAFGKKPESIVKKLVIGIIIHWKDLIEELRKNWDKLGYDSGDLKELLRQISERINSLDYLIKKHCDQFNESLSSFIKQSLCEALDPREQERKMRGWHNGTYHQERTITRMHNEKLHMNLDICRIKGFFREAEILRDEAADRKLPFVNPIEDIRQVVRRYPMISPSPDVLLAINQQNQQKAQTQSSSQTAANEIISLGENDFRLDIAKAVKENENFPNRITAKYATKELLMSLVFAIILHLNKDCLDQIKQKLKETMSETNIKASLKLIINNQDTLDKIQEIVNQIA